MMRQDPFDNVFGPVRILVDKLRESEQQGFLFNMTEYLKHAIIVLRTNNYPLVYDIFLPTFAFYFRVVVDKDNKTQQIYISDFLVLTPETLEKETEKLEEMISKMEDME